MASAGGEGTLHRLFAMEVVDFAAGSALGDIHHLVLEARRVSQSPPTPCFGGHLMGRPDRGGVSLLECPEASSESERATLHGEGAHAGHTLGYWDVSGIRYAISVHGLSVDARRLVERMIQGIELIGA